MRLTLASSALSTLALFSACTPSVNQGTDASTNNDARSVDVPPVGDVSTIPTECEPGAMHPAGSTCVLGVSGQALAEGGMPFAHKGITVCGSTCFAGETDDQGRFVVPVGSYLVGAAYSVQVHGRPDYVSAYWALPTVGADRFARFTTPLTVYRYMNDGQELPESRMIAAQTPVTVGAVTLTFAANSMVEYDLEDFEFGAMGRRVRSAEVPLMNAPPFAQLGAVQGPVWGLAPYAMTSTAPVGVRVANRAMLPANSAVEFVQMGMDTLAEPPTAGVPVVAARGRVSADGMTIETLPGEGLRILSWIGVRPMR